MVRKRHVHSVRGAAFGKNQPRRTNVSEQDSEPEKLAFLSRPVSVTRQQQQRDFVGKAFLKFLGTYSDNKNYCFGQFAKVEGFIQNRLAANSNIARQVERPSGPSGPVEPVRPPGPPGNQHKRSYELFRYQPNAHRQSLGNRPNNRADPRNVQTMEKMPAAQSFSMPMGTNMGPGQPRRSLQMQLPGTVPDLKRISQASPQQITLNGVDRRAVQVVLDSPPENLKSLSLDGQNGQLEEAPNGQVNGNSDQNFNMNLTVKNVVLPTQNGLIHFEPEIDAMQSPQTTVTMPRGNELESESSFFEHWCAILYLYWKLRLCDLRRSDF